MASSISAALDAFDGRGSKDSCFEATPKIGGLSAVDVLVCTPGRLVDHLDSTPGFTLQHLRFIVIDEADRLVNQPYQNWIRRVLQASNSENRFEADFRHRSSHSSQRGRWRWSFVAR